MRQRRWGLTLAAVGIVLVQVGLSLGADWLRAHGVEISQDTVLAIRGLGTVASGLLGAVAVTRLPSTTSSKE